MSYIVKIVVMLTSVSLLTTACAKKNKSANRSTPVAAQPAELSGDLSADESAPEVTMLEEQAPETRRPHPQPRDYEVSEEVSRTPRPAPQEEDFREDITDDRAPFPRSNPEQVVDTTENKVARNTQCGTAYRRNTVMWAPGLPYAPSAQRICTGGLVNKPDHGRTFQCDGSRDIVFTDSRRDGLMALAVERMNKLPRQMDLGSRELARRIRDVKVQADVNGSGAVNAQITLLIADRRYEKFNFRGQLRNWKGRSRADVELRSVNNRSRLKFNVVLTCADIGRGCQNSLLRLQQLTRRGNIGRVAYVVHRLGDAHVTMSEQDRIAFRHIGNSGHARFAEYLSNTAYNTCVAVLRDAFAGVRQLPSCAFQRLKNQCGHRAQFKRPAAKAFEFRSWAVAYGRAGFEFEMLDSAARFVVKGPLVASSQTPVWPRALQVTGAFASSVERAILVANDGGGNLNLQIDFRGQQKSHTRVSVTTLMEDVRFTPERIVEQARQMPMVPPGQIADEREQQEQEEADPQDDPQYDSQERTVPFRQQVLPPAELPSATPVPAREEDDNQTIQPSEIDPGAERPE